MKTTITLALLAVLFTGCSTTCAQSSRSATDQFDVTPFTAILSSVVANIEIRQSSTTSVTAEGSEALLDILEVRMDNGKLVLDMEDRHLKKFKGNADKLVIFITTPTLSEIDSEGVGNIEIHGTFSSPELVIDSEGVGNFRADNLDTGFIRISSEGVGNITLGGKADRVEISSEGVGNVNASKLVSRSTTVSSQGVGNVSCHASEYLKVRSDGIGSVTYYGNPADTDFSKNGIGKIKAGN